MSLYTVSNNLTYMETSSVKDKMIWIFLSVHNMGINSRVVESKINYSRIKKIYSFMLCSNAAYC